MPRSAVEFQRKGCCMKRFPSVLIGCLLAVSTHLVKGEGEPEPRLPFCFSPSGLAPVIAPEPPPETYAAQTTPVEVQPLPKASDERMDLQLQTIHRDYVLEDSVQKFEGINGSPALIPPPPRNELGGAAGWVKTEVLDPALSLEVVKIRQVALTGSIITAVKRKNPLYLLNPLVFAVSWQPSSPVPLLPIIFWEDAHGRTNTSGPHSGSKVPFIFGGAR